MEKTIEKTTQAKTKKQTEVRHQKAKPILAIELPADRSRKSLSLKEENVQLLSAYAEFLSKHHSKAIGEDMVIDGLIESLRRDKLFIAWSKEQSHA